MDNTTVLEENSPLGRLEDTQIDPTEAAKEANCAQLYCDVTEDIATTNSDAGSRQQEKEQQKERNAIFGNKIVDLITGLYLIYLCYATLSRVSSAAPEHLFLLIAGGALLGAAGIFFVIYAGKLLIDEIKRNI